MCIDPITAGAIALSTVGTVMQGREAAKNERRMETARSGEAARELQRQRGLRDEARGLFAQGMSRFEPEQRAQGEAAAVENRQTRNLAAVSDEAGDFEGFRPDAPKVVTEGLDSARGEAVGRNRQQATARGALQGIGDLGLADTIALGNNRLDMGTIGDTARRSSGINEMEQRVSANNARRAPNPLWDIAKAGGAGLGLAGAISGASSFGELFNRIKLGQMGGTYIPPVPGVPGSAMIQSPLPPL